MDGQAAEPDVPPAGRTSPRSARRGSTSGPRSSARSGERVRRRPWALGLLPAVFLAVFFAWPVLDVLRRGLSTAGLDVLTKPSTRHILWFTTWQAVVSTALTVLLGMPLAFVLHRYALPGRRAASCPGHRAVRAADGRCRGGLPARCCRHLGRGSAARSCWRTCSSTWRSWCASSAACGLTWTRGTRPPHDRSGASPWRAFRTVTWPLLRPAVAAASILVFLFTFTSFGVVLVLGGPSTVTLEVEVYRRTAQLLDLSGAAALAIVQLVLLGAVLVVSGRLQARLAVRQRTRADHEVLAPVRGRAGGWRPCPGRGGARRSPAAGAWSPSRSGSVVGGVSPGGASCFGLP